MGIWPVRPPSRGDEGLYPLPQVHAVNPVSSNQDTIAAIATPPGRGGIGIVRLSGPLVQALAGALLPRLPAPRKALFTAFLGRDREPLDNGIALFFLAPHSFTGEDVLELQGHGGPVVMDMLLQRVLSLGVRLARPGEFTERAFLNGKLDLAQAEAVADLITSTTHQAARSALCSLQGAFSKRVYGLVDALIRLRTFVEGALDFPEEEGFDFLDDARLRHELQACLGSLAQLLREAHRGQVLKDGLRAVICGPPNAGKSSLLNRLARHECAIVTDVPGTTRDLIREEIAIDGLPVHLVDTAGLRVTTDRIEQEGIRRTWASIDQADHILFVIEYGSLFTYEAQEALKSLPKDNRYTLIHNKIDLQGIEPRIIYTDQICEIFVSVKTGAGIDLLEQHLKECAGYSEAQEGAFSARRRHLEALRRAKDHLEVANWQLLETAAGELVAESLRAAQRALSEITGEFTTEDLLGQIFSTFCIGK
jgi:tRNA modification GTPase